MAWDRIVDCTDTGPQSESTNLLQILRSRIAERLIIDDKGQHPIDKDKAFIVYLQYLATASTVEKQAKDYRWRKQSCLPHLQVSIITDFGETAFDVSDGATGIWDDLVAL